jgi:hypothetical protein
MGDSERVAEVRRRKIVRVESWAQDDPSRSGMTREKLLVILLRLAGIAMLPAFLAIFLPTNWMIASHRWLGLGEFPDSALVQYLTRSIAALYGFHGLLALIVSLDVRRYRPIVWYLAAMNVAFGIAMILIDLHAGMPWYWTVAEGPPIAARD